MTNQYTPSTVEFDASVPGYLSEEGGLTTAGEIALDEHFELINDAVQCWAAQKLGVVVEFTDHVAVTAYGRAAKRGESDGLWLAPDHWVECAELALVEIIEQLTLPLAGGELAPTDTGWELNGTDRTVADFPEELIKDQTFERIEDVIDTLAIYRDATAAPLLRDLEDALDGVDDVDALSADFDGVASLAEAEAIAARVRNHYQHIEHEADVAWDALSDLIAPDRRALALASAATRRRD
ncbi:hypothetical protein [Microbacterium sp. NPDC079995]|uniref:hypothetical protein n=1 Tax=unclassified Microbacterium TaxID=2609290 RepID=UPI00344D7098